MWVPQPAGAAPRLAHRRLVDAASHMRHRTGILADHGRDDFKYPNTPYWGGLGGQCIGIYVYMECLGYVLRSMYIPYMDSSGNCSYQAPTGLFCQVFRGFVETSQVVVLKLAWLPKRWAEFGIVLVLFGSTWNFGIHSILCKDSPTMLRSPHTWGFD